MKHFITILLTLSLPHAVVFANDTNPGELVVTSLADVLEHFADPPAAYRPAPLYVWNGDMQEDEIARQLDELKAGGFGGVFVHPRPGLITPYLSDRWLELWRFTAKEAEKRGMVTYIYDENSYPSGFAGGHVPEKIPDSAQESLRREELKGDQIDDLVLNADTVALYRVTDTQTGAFERVAIPNLTAGETVSAGSLNLKPGTYIHYSVQYPEPSPWYGGKTYVDVMRPDVTQCFLDTTFGAYDKVLSDLYGKEVLASFTDEPQVAGGWSPMIPKAFQERWGYDLLECLPSIHRDAGDWRKVRHDYSATILDLFMNNFAKLYSEACDKRGIAFTGHVWEHGWPGINHNPDIMSFYRWQRWPGIDCLMNMYSEDTNAQFGNYRSNKELDSIANQFGRVRRLCETYGAGGWDLTLQDVKRIGDHLYAGGINLINPHLSYYTIVGARKRDHPQSFSYHEPYWEAFHIPMDYFGRLSWSLAAGKSNNPLLIIEPTVTMWMYNWSPSQGKILNKLGSEFQSFITELGAAQVAFDLGSEPVMANHASVQGGHFVIGERAYDAVILPPGLQCLERTTVEQLREYASHGGTIISYAGVPEYVDGVPSDAVQAVKTKAGDRWIEKPLSPDELASRWGNGEVSIQAQKPANGRVYHILRDLDEGKLLFFCNTSLEAESKIQVTAKGGYAEHWDAVTGKVETISFHSDRSGNVSFDYLLPPVGSALFAIYQTDPKHKTVKPPSWPENVSPKTPSSGLTVTMQEPNVLILDYVDSTINGKTQKDVYFYDAQTALYKSHGFPRNPWDSGVQFNDEIIKQDHFPNDPGFAFRYAFTLDGFQSMPELELVIEQGKFYTVTVNGHALQPEDGAWRIDRSFLVYKIDPQWLSNGSNAIITRADSFSLFMEPEAVYLFGNFNLQSGEKGFTLIPQTPLKLGEWNAQGAPFYSGTVAYTQAYTFNNASKTQHFIELQDWNGTAARVEVNGKNAGYILWQPWRLDIGQYLHDGKNTVTVVVFGSLKNLLGPHHAGKERGRAWPNMFHINPQGGQPAGNMYDTIGYGLQKPFVVYE